VHVNSNKWTTGRCSLPFRTTLAQGYSNCGTLRLICT